MESQNRRPPGYLKQTLLKKGTEFSFFQAIRLLRHLNRDNQDNSSISFDWSTLHIVPNLSLTFPASDIEKITTLQSEESTQYQITANFLGLYGTSSPLPTFYTEELMDEAANDLSAGRDFINILNQQLYRLFFEGWEKYRQGIQVIEQQKLLCVERLFCLEGFSGSFFQNDHSNANQLLRYIGLFSQFPRSASGLTTLLEDALGLPVEVIPCITRQVAIPEDQQLCLGISGNVLGHDCIIGRVMNDRMGKFRLSIGPLNAEDYRGFFPGSATYDKLVQLTNLYLQDPLEYDMEVFMSVQQARTTCLGGNRWSKLGMDTWLYAGEEIGTTKNIFHPTHLTTQ